MFLNNKSLRSHEVIETQRRDYSILKSAHFLAFLGATFLAAFLGAALAFLATFLGAAFLATFLGAAFLAATFLAIQNLD